MIKQTKENIANLKNYTSSSVDLDLIKRNCVRMHDSIFSEYFLQSIHMHLYAVFLCLFNFNADSSANHTIVRQFEIRKPYPFDFFSFH